MSKKNYSINEDYQKINLMIKKEIVNKIKEKTKKANYTWRYLCPPGNSKVLATIQ